MTLTGNVLREAIMVVVVEGGLLIYHSFFNSTFTFLDNYLTLNILSFSLVPHYISAAFSYSLVLLHVWTINVCFLYFSFWSLLIFHPTIPSRYSHSSQALVPAASCILLSLPISLLYAYTTITVPQRYNYFNSLIIFIHMICETCCSFLYSGSL